MIRQGPSLVGTPRNDISSSPTVTTGPIPASPRTTAIPSPASTTRTPPPMSDGWNARRAIRIVCRPRPSGNMPAVPAPKPRASGATTATVRPNCQCRRPQPGRGDHGGRSERPGTIFPARRRLSIHLTGRYLSAEQVWPLRHAWQRVGVVPGSTGPRLQEMFQKTARHAQPQIILLRAFSVAAPGSTFPGSSARAPGSGSIPGSGTHTSVSVWPGRCRLLNLDSLALLFLLADHPAQPVANFFGGDCLAVMNAADFACTTSSWPARR